MQFSIDWERGDQRSGDIDLLAVGALRLLVDSVNVCEFRETRGGGVRESLPVSVYPLAEGIAMDWWRLFGGRDVWLRLFKHRGGYAIPDVRWRFDGVDFEIACRPRCYDNPPASFPNGADERLGRGDAERALGVFLTEVIGRLEECGVRDSGLQLQWRLLQKSRKDPEETAFCEAAGALGLDAYDISEADAAFIEESGALFDGEALVEYLSGVRDVPRPDRSVGWIRELERRPRYKSRLPALEHPGAGASEACGDRARGLKPWERGYRWARAIRRMIDAPQGERFRTVTALTRRLDAPSFESTPLAPGVCGLVEAVEGETRIHLRRLRNSAGRLFAFARAIGDAVANPPARWSAVNYLHDASRQACGRAFAAEFLAPIEEILSMRGDGRDTGAIADEFGVLPELVERQEENADRIRRACA